MLLTRARRERVIRVGFRIVFRGFEYREDTTILAAIAFFFLAFFYFSAGVRAERFFRPFSSGGTVDVVAGE